MWFKKVRTGSMCLNHPEQVHYTIYIVAGETRCAGCLCTCSGWFKHIEPRRTFPNHIITEIANCVEFCHMSSGWFDLGLKQNLHKPAAGRLPLLSSPFLRIMPLGSCKMNFELELIVLISKTLMNGMLMMKVRRCSLLTAHHDFYAFTVVSR